MESTAATTPLPLDIPLPLPADPILLQALLVVLFLWHILFVNLMVGGSLLTVVFELIGRRRPEFDALARATAGTVTVNKSLAVVLGVGPLLGLNVLYTVHFYSANALTGAAWISLVPLVTLAFLVTYAHKYSWDRLAGRKGLHLAIGMAGAAMFLAIPLIFLANINLMLFPARWLEVRGFASALALPNVWPRYLHFLAASVAVTGLFLLVYFLRPGGGVAASPSALDRLALRRLFYGIALGASALQLMFGPLVLITLPRPGLSWFLAGVIGVGVVLAIFALVLMWREIAAPRANATPRAAIVVALITATAFTMGYGRHVYRETALRDHRAQMAVHTRDTGWLAAAAQWREATGQGVAQVPLGQRIFESTCAACHGVDRVLVGPSLREIAGIYGGDPGGIAAWAADPGRKRPELPPMPAFRLGEEKLRAVADYMLQLGSGGSPAEDG
ncbi:MAG TPA: cytochrome c [Candidatus Krumholzibacteria bacterium]|nr:cytochrome c [Candidatus Krumholzibacteria bacterium]HPD73179.1 cytochrome c [Candidatus Krumholzibacteria bacterium]HRY41943.1 cytochrome c [Candidatus Krumholzibacteria bacterium]